MHYFPDHHFIFVSNTPLSEDSMMKFGSVKILIPFLESEKQVINTFDDIRWSVFGLLTPFLEEIISEKIVVLSSTFVTSK